MGGKDNPGVFVSVCVRMRDSRTWVRTAWSMCLSVPQNERAHWLPRGGTKEKEEEEEEEGGWVWRDRGVRGWRMMIQRGGGVCSCVYVWWGRSGDQDQQRCSAHFIFIFPSFHREASRVSGHSTRTGCQNLDLEPDGADQSGYGNTIWME